MTKKENFVAIKNILNGIGNVEFDAFLDHEVELVSRKRTSTKPTKRQVENAVLKERIAEVLDTENGVTASEIVKLIGDEGLTNQRVSALLRQMDGVRKETVKGKSLFFAE